MQTVEEFLAYSVHLEQDAALRFDQLADAMDACGNQEVGKLFRRLAVYSRMHLSEARARSAYRDVPSMKPSDSLPWTRTGSGNRSRGGNRRFQLLQEHSRHHGRPRNQDFRKGVCGRGERACRGTQEMARRTSGRRAIACRSITKP